MSASVAVFGNGRWGAALANHLKRQGHAVHVWSYPNDNLAEIAAAADLWLLVVPSHAFMQTCQQLKPCLREGVQVVWGTKGLSADGELLHTAAKTVLGDVPLGVISGPSFAAEVDNNMPTAVVAASDDAAFAQQLVDLFHGPTFRVYANHDIEGVELCGVVKNVLAIAAGVVHGLGLGANTQAALITRGLAEMQRLVLAVGGKTDTVYGLAGMGDLVLTCTDDQSRNRRLGTLLGQGLAVEDALKQLPGISEGYYNAKILQQLAAQHDVDMPITEQVCAVLYHNLSAKQALQQLLAREPKAE